VIELPAVQQGRLEKLRATGRPIAFGLMSGSAIAVPWANENLNAIVEAWYPGQAAGTAVADVLLGRVNPSGRLPLTFYRGTADLPAFEDYRMENRTYRYFRGQPLWAFGHGLSYTKFAYDGPKAFPPARRGEQPRILVSVEVGNTGERDGEEVVQLYATPPGAREREALCGFARVPLGRGEKRTVTFAVPPTALRRWSVEQHDYVIPRGEWTLRIGASSADIRQTITAQIE